MFVLKILKLFLMSDLRTFGPCCNCYTVEERRLLHLLTTKTMSEKIM